MSAEHPPSRAPLAPIAGSIAQTRRSLLEREQFLGICPTWWFWNDWHHQRLLMPLILLTAVPVVAIIQVLTVAFPAASVLLLLAPLLYAFVLQGLVERHIRAQLRRRALTFLGEPAPERSLHARRYVSPALAVAGVGTACALLGLPALTTLALIAASIGLAVLVAALPSIATRLAARRPPPPAISHSPRD